MGHWDGFGISGGWVEFKGNLKGTQTVNETSDAAAIRLLLGSPLSSLTSLFLNHYHTKHDLKSSSISSITIIFFIFSIQFFIILKFEGFFFVKNLFFFC